MVIVLGVRPVTCNPAGLPPGAGGFVCVGGAVCVGVTVVVVPAMAVSTGVVTPLPRTEYRYGVLGCKPMSVNDGDVTVAIRIPERNTS